MMRPFWRRVRSIPANLGVSSLYTPTQDCHSSRCFSYGFIETQLLKREFNSLSFLCRYKIFVVGFKTGVDVEGQVLGIGCLVSFCYVDDLSGEIEMWLGLLVRIPLPAVGRALKASAVCAPSILTRG